MAEANALLSAVSESPNGFVHSSVAISSSSSLNNGSDDVQARGLFCFEDIAKGTPLIKVPVEFVLSPDENESNPANVNAKADSHGPPAAQLPPMSNWLKTVLAVMKVMVKGKDAPFPFAHYVESLPTSSSAYDTLMDWSEEEVSQLKGTALFKALSEDRSRGVFRSRFESHVKPRLAELHGLTDLEISKLTYEVFELASKAVVTRGFHYEEEEEEEQQQQQQQQQGRGSSLSGGPFMIPIVDMLNHDHDSSRKCTTLRRDGGGNFYMNAERDIKKVRCSTYASWVLSSLHFSTFLTHPSLTCAGRRIAALLWRPQYQRATSENVRLCASPTPHLHPKGRWKS